MYCSRLEFLLHHFTRCLKLIFSRSQNNVSYPVHSLCTQVTALSSKGLKTGCVMSTSKCTCRHMRPYKKAYVSILHEKIGKCGVHEHDLTVRAGIQACTILINASGCGSICIKVMQLSHTRVGKGVATPDYM